MNLEFKKLLFTAIKSTKIGVWRSLVARSAGGRKVAGSSPATPTTFLKSNDYSAGTMPPE